MLILAFDTSGAGCSVALWRDGQVLADIREHMERGQAEALMPMIDRTMTGSGFQFSDLDRIAVTVGPGSFTGVRVGLAAARGLTLATGKPSIGLLTTEVLAAAVSLDERRGRRVLAAIDTKRGDLYVQQFETGTTTTPVAIAIDRLATWLGSGPVVIAGDGAKVAAEAVGEAAILAAAGPLPSAPVLAALAATRAPSPPLPVYIHPPAITPSTAPQSAPS